MVLSPEPVSTEQQLALQSHQPVLGCAGWLPGYLLTLEYLCVITQFHNIDKLTTQNKLKGIQPIIQYLVFSSYWIFKSDSPPPLSIPNRSGVRLFLFVFSLYQCPVLIYVSMALLAV